ncbi:DeoR/GlpR family DNA-binding transcription regulator [Streptomyces sp. DSM 41527]|uniref:DeoR/GlpR family DNA-binding transcription regulator n=1 Tax=Streptomyces mooreae TaxID=3075523 RepID=A0ABU2T093_9ACTN|nr:DeoR/GlpR family DNA-binding transcription regulator [Streptomyces sp. DSM 41527]MDT0454663.1 DeoR/GlpR family DNA-binding transcription regulator [Streptomyces sp. DSM 41527]
MTSGERSATRHRRERMVELLGTGDISVHDLAAEFDVSLSTVRRDLATLAALGRITRTYGGAVDHRAVERSWHDKEGEQRGEKAALARTAAALVRPGDVVLLDAGTTVARLAHELRERADLTIVTNGLSALVELADAEVEVVVLGGRLRRPNESLLGTRTDQALRRLTPDIAFLGVDGLDPRRGINCPDPEQAALKETMAECARAAWVLADHSKLGGGGSGGAGFPYWAAMPAGTGLISGAGERELAAFTDEGWSVCAAVDGGPAPAGSARPHTS